MTKYERYTSKDGATLTMSQWGGSPAELEFYRKLAALEDKIEDGTLKFMPCNVDEMLYEVIKGMPIQEWKVESINFNRVYPNGVMWAQRTSDFAHWKFWVEDCGTKWFATKAEAEAKLRELKGGRE